MERLRFECEWSSEKGSWATQNHAVWCDTNMGVRQGKVKANKQLNLLDFTAFLNAPGRNAGNDVLQRISGATNGRRNLPVQNSVAGCRRGELQSPTRRARCTSAIVMFFPPSTIATRPAKWSAPSKYVACAFAESRP